MVRAGDVSGQGVDGLLPQVASLSATATDVQREGPASTSDRTGWWRPPTAVRPVFRELVMVLVIYVLYGQIRNVVAGQESTAEAFARWLLTLERSWGLDVELGINQWVALREPVAVAMNYYYAVLHMLVPIAVLIWLRRRHPAAYSLSRNALVLGSLIALLGYWLLPLAPPRLLPSLGFVDTFWFYDTWGSLSDPALAQFSNQYAAMPSLHVGWALWVGVVLVVVSHRWWLPSVSSSVGFVVARLARQRSLIPAFAGRLPRR